MSLVISSNQKSANKDHNIFEITCSLRDKIAEPHIKQKKAYLVSFDLEKAFDRVEDAFLLKTMENMGINDSFVDLIRKIRSMSFSRILINGKLSSEIQIKRSVRQGDPLSMHLFVIYLEPLIQKLKHICNGELNFLGSFADDVTVVVDCIEKVEQIKNIFYDFGLISGARLNLLKTECLIIGNGTDLLFQPDWLNVKQNIKILGVLFCNEFKEMIDKNWISVSSSLSKLLWLHKSRNLNKI